MIDFFSYVYEYNGYSITDFKCKVSIKSYGDYAFIHVRDIIETTLISSNSELIFADIINTYKYNPLKCRFFINAWEYNHYSCHEVILDWNNNNDLWVAEYKNFNKSIDYDVFKFLYYVN